MQRTKEQINADIQAIFKRHKLTPATGEEGFWDAVYDVATTNNADGDRLYELAAEWDAAPYADQPPAVQLNDLKFKRTYTGFGEHGPEYWVEVAGITLGVVEATTFKRRGGRSKANYYARHFVRPFEPCVKAIGVGNSREAAAQLIVARLQKSANGTRLLRRAGINIQTSEKE